MTDDYLKRSVPFDIERADDSGDGFTMEGYAAVFDTPTRIDSWEGKFDEKIVRGAFAKTLKERKPVVMFNHGHSTVLDQIPIARLDDIKEDERGLFIKARLFDNDLVLPIRQAIEGGAIDGMSFRFQVVKDTWDDSGDVPVRTLNEVRLMELGPVVFPAYAATSVGVRSDFDLAALFNLPESDRASIARALILGTPPEAGSTTSGDEEPPSREPREHSRNCNKPQLLLRVRSFRKEAA